MNPDVRVFDDLAALSRAAAEAAADTLARAARAEGRCALVLSGGSTPRTMYQLLASEWRDRIPWAVLHVFWGDDRYVPHDDARSNYRMAKETLLDYVQLPPSNVHPMPTYTADPGLAAHRYEVTIREYFAGGSPRFDLVLLGLGEDAHTASLFPGSPALTERTRWVVPVTAPAEPPVRLTLTLPALAHAGAIYVLAAGPEKAQAFAHAMAAASDPALYPAAAVRRLATPVTWWVDEQAAREFVQAGTASRAVGR